MPETTARTPRLRLAFFALLAAAGVKLLLAVTSFGFVAVYAHLVAPGQGAAAYEEFAQRAVPYYAAVLGAPLLFATAFLFERRWPRQQVGAWLFGAYLALDLPFLWSMGLAALLPCAIAYLLAGPALATGVRRARHAAAPPDGDLQAA